MTPQHRPYGLAESEVHAQKTSGTDVEVFVCYGRACQTIC